MTFEDVWRQKGDEQLLAASRALDEYDESARVAIISELRRRQADGILSPDLIEGAIVGDGPPDPQPGSLLPRLWRGDVSLAQTFWVYGFATHLAIRAVLVVLATLPRNALVATAIAIGALAYILYIGFVSVAIWRSAGRYRGAPSWRNLARLWVILTLLAFALNVLNAIGTVLRHFQY